MLTIDNCIFIIIDVQEALSRVVLNKEAFCENLQKIIKGAQVLEIPIIMTEQNPNSLGPTVDEIRSLLPEIQPVSKVSFSCCGEKNFIQALNALGRKQALLAGIETHICVYQTAMDLLEMEYEVQVLSDCVASRTAENKTSGLKKMKAHGAEITSAEMVLFELLRVAEGEKFKKISRIVK